MKKKRERWKKRRERKPDFIAAFVSQTTKTFLLGSDRYSRKERKNRKKIISGKNKKSDEMRS